MRPEEIEDLMRSMNQQKVVVTVEDEGNEYTLPELPDLERVPPRLTVRPESPTRNRRFRSDQPVTYVTHYGDAHHWPN